MATSKPNPTRPPPPVSGRPNAPKSLTLETAATKALMLPVEPRTSASWVRGA